MVLDVGTIAKEAVMASRLLTRKAFFFKNCQLKDVLTEWQIAKVAPRNFLKTSAKYWKDNCAGTTLKFDSSGSISVNKIVRNLELVCIANGKQGGAAKHLSCLFKELASSALHTRLTSKTKI